MERCARLAGRTAFTSLRIQRGARRGRLERRCGGSAGRSRSGYMALRRSIHEPAEYVVSRRRLFLAVGPACIPPGARAHRAAEQSARKENLGPTWIAGLRTPGRRRRRNSRPERGCSRRTPRSSTSINQLGELEETGATREPDDLCWRPTFAASRHSAKTRQSHYRSGEGAAA